MKDVKFIRLGIIMMIITPILGIITLVWMFGKMADDVSSFTKEYEATLGTKVVLTKDTLTVVDYSIIKSTVILSNTQSISFEFYKKIKLK